MWKLSQCPDIQKILNLNHRHQIPCGSWQNHFYPPKVPQSCQNAVRKACSSTAYLIKPCTFLFHKRKFPLNISFWICNDLFLIQWNFWLNCFSFKWNFDTISIKMKKNYSVEKIYFVQNCVSYILNGSREFVCRYFFVNIEFNGFLGSCRREVLSVILWKVENS